MKQLDNIYEVTQRLCGMIEPVGDSNIDETRFRNLENTIDLTEKLIRDLIQVSKYKDQPEHSMNKVGKEADTFLTSLTEQIHEH